MTETQEYFIKVMPYIRLLGEKKRRGTISQEDEQFRKKMILKLWEKVKFYAWGLITEGMKLYRKPSDYCLDLEQDCFVIFSEHLMDYDPERTAPTTYFKPYFFQVITMYKHSYSQYMTANEAKNAAKVSHCIEKYEEKGVRFDYKTISIETGLSEKVVEKTVNRMKTSIHADIDDVVLAVSPYEYPETVYEREEMESMIYAAIDETLSLKEKELLLIRVFGNKENKRYMPYKKIAERYNLTLREAKEMWESIIAKLRVHPMLVQYKVQSEE